MKLDYETCAAVAVRFTTKRDFRREADSEYQWLQRNGLFAKATVHMEPLRRTLSDAEVQYIALKYKSRRAFKLADQSAYMTARRRGIIDSVCAHMDVKHRVLTNAQLINIAVKYETRSEFDEKDTGAYQTAYKRGLLDIVCAHMKDSRATRRQDDTELLAIAKTYTTRNDLKLGDFGTYTTILRRGLEEQACAHMEPGSTGFREDLPAVLYQFRMETEGGLVLYKVGITNRLPMQRLRTMGTCAGLKSTLVKVIEFEHGRDARIAEKRLHRRFSAQRYTGEPVMKNGNTELFLVPLLDN